MVTKLKRLKVLRIRQAEHFASGIIYNRYRPFGSIRSRAEDTCTNKVTSSRIQIAKDAGRVCYILRSQYRCEICVFRNLRFHVIAHHVVPCCIYRIRSGAQNIYIRSKAVGVNTFYVNIINTKIKVVRRSIAILECQTCISISSRDGGIVHFKILPCSSAINSKQVYER